MGSKQDDQKPRWDLMPMRVLDEVASVLTFGAVKYGPYDWQSVPNAKDRYLAAALRHISAHMQGETVDQESGYPHLAHAITSLMITRWHDGKDD